MLPDPRRAPLRRAPLRRRLVAVCAVLALPALGACSGDDDTPSSPSSGGSATPTPTDTSTPAPATPTPAQVSQPLRKQARTTSDDYLAALADALADPSKKSASANSDLVAGNALAQLRNQAEELGENGQRVVGKAELVKVTVVGRTEQPSTLTVAACVDSSRVRVVDEQGKPVTGQQSARQRTLNLLTLEERAGRWVVVDQEFPDNADC